jgi:superfamily II DNA helicase RecQ
MDFASPSQPLARRRANHVGDICEIPPTSKASCRACGRRIVKGEPRVGKEDFFDREQKYIRRYFHKGCFQELPGDHLINGRVMVSRSLDEDFEDVQHEEFEKQRIVAERYELRESLRRLRTRLALRFGVEPYMFFYDTTLDDLVLKMPQTRAEILKVFGIKEKKYNKFGCAIIAVIRGYCRNHPDDLDLLQAERVASSPI